MRPQKKHRPRGPVTQSPGRKNGEAEAKRIALSIEPRSDASDGRPPSAALKIAWQDIIFALLSLAWLLIQDAPTITGTDDAGYWNQASHLAAFGTLTRHVGSNLEYLPYHWHGDVASGIYHSKYGPGLPLMVGAAIKIAGLNSAFWLQPLFGVAALAGFYLLAARAINRSWALLGAVLLGINHTFLCRVAIPVAHLPVAALFLMACALLVAWDELGGTWRIFLAGALMGSIPAVRSPDVVLWLGPGVYLWSSERFAKSARSVQLSAVFGLLIPVVALLVGNQLVHGAFWRTGYSRSSEQSAFLGPWFVTHLIQYLRLLVTDGLGPVFLAGALGMGFMVAQETKNRFGTLALPAAAAQILLYSAYYWAPLYNPEDTMRFLMPTFPLYFISGLWLLRRSVEALEWRARAVIVALAVCLQSAWQGLNGIYQFQLIGYQKAVLALIAEGARKHIPSSSLVVAHPIIQGVLEYDWNWKLVDAQVFTTELEDPNLPQGVAVPFQVGRDPARLGKYLALPVSQRGPMLAKDLGQWSSQSDLYVISQGKLRQLVEEAFAPMKCLKVATLDLPLPPVWPKREGRHGAAIDVIQPASSEGTWDQDLRANAPAGLTPRFFIDFLNVRNPVPIFRCPLPR